MDRLSNKFLAAAVKYPTIPQMRLFAALRNIEVRKKNRTT